MKFFTHLDWKGRYIYLNENYEEDSRQGKYFDIEKNEIVLCWNNLMVEIDFLKAFNDEIFTNHLVNIYKLLGKSEFKLICESYEKTIRELNEKIKYSENIFFKTIELLCSQKIKKGEMKENER